MRLTRLTAMRFDVPFRVVFRHASASRRRTQNVVVVAHAAGGAVGYGEGCPREYVTGESPETAWRFVSRFAQDLVDSVTCLDSLRAWIADHRADIDANPAAFCAMEMAVLDVLGKETGASLERILELPRPTGAIRYSAVIGGGPYLAAWWQFRRYRFAGFEDFKLKLTGDDRRDRRRLGLFRARPALRVRVDANNLWADAGDCLSHIAALGHPLFAIEEPLCPRDWAGMETVARTAGCRVVLDESLTRLEDLDALADPSLWIANLRVSKLGGLIRSLALAEAAKARGIGVIVGAQVGETGLLTRAGIALGHAVGNARLAMEGAFGTRLLARDLTDPSPAFGHQGILEAERVLDIDAPGLGLRVDGEALSPFFR